MSILLTGVQLRKRDFVVAAIPYFPLFAWYYVFSYNMLRFIVDETTPTFSIYSASFNFVVSLALILSSFFIRRIDKTLAIFSWSLLSSAGTILITLAPSAVKLAIYLLLGVGYAIALLAYFVFFWDLTIPEEEGRVAGFIGSLLLPILPLVVVLLQNLDLFGTAAFCIILNLAALMIRLLNPERITGITKKRSLKRYNPEKRTILLYLVPWAIFSLINATFQKTVYFHISRYLLPPSPALFAVLQDIGAGLGAITGGTIADFFGRRFSLILGLTLFGLSSSISGLTTTNEGFLLAFIGTGLTWGIFLTLYLFVVWGDLCTEETCPHRYSVGLATFYLATVVGNLSEAQLFQIPLMVASITSCLLIFVSIIPLVLAPELLPLDFREKIRVKFYTYLVKREKAKYLSNHG